MSEVTKLASICDPVSSYLVVLPEGSTLKIAGIATPVGTDSLSADTLVRVLAPRPGTLILCRGTIEVVRYERGTILQPPPEYVALGAHTTQLASIATAGIGLATPTPLGRQYGSGRLFAEFFQVVSAMSRLGRGGIIAVLGPKDPAESLLHGTRVLSPPVRFGAALREQEMSAFRAYGQRRYDVAPTEDARRDNERNLIALQAASRRLDTLREQLVRFSAVDGAVLLNHALDVLAFGVKLQPPSKSPLSEVYTVTDRGLPGDRWPIEVRGTRHRAAAAFAHEHREGLAFIVSQDGDAGIFQSLESKVVYWPLSVPFPFRE